MSPTIEIYDTTLRDGTQGHGITFSVADKLRIAERLDAFGVAYVEGGWPGSNPRDIEVFDEGGRRRGDAGRYERRVAAGRRGGDYAARLRSAARARRDSHARRHRPRRRQRAGGGRGRRDARAGDDQRVRRTHGQLQPHLCHSEPALQAEEAVRAGGIAADAHRALAVRRRDRERAAPPAAPLGRS